MTAREPAIMIAHAAKRPAVTTFSFRGASDQRSPTKPILANAPLVSSSLAIARATTSHRAGTNQMPSDAPDGRRLPSGSRGTGDSDLRLSSKDSIYESSVASMCGGADSSNAGATGAAAPSIRIRPLLTLEAHPLPVGHAPGAQYGRHHRDTAGGTDRRVLVIGHLPPRYRGNRRP